MRVVYFGTAEFAVPALRAVVSAFPGSVKLVVSQPDRPSGRGLKLVPSPVRRAAMELEIPVETPERARAPEFVERLRSLDADVLLVAAYGQILSTSVLESARRGGINLHGSILPKYRGAAPIQRCILEGDTETGVTLMQMDKGMDTGDMIAVARTPIGADETYGVLQERLSQIAAALAVEWMPGIASGDYPRTPQDHDAATYAPKVEKAEAELRWDMSCEEAYRRFRAFTPAPGAFIRTGLGHLKLVNARLGSKQGPPGTYLGGDEIGFRHGSLALVEVQPEGKKRMQFRDFANGARLRPGDSLA
jgi:methionyl-tRNA formyltransferase